MSDSHREFHAKAAKRLLKSVRARDAAALARVRAVLHGKRALSDDELADQVGLQNCQHVIAKEAGYTKWSELAGASPSPPCTRLKGYSMFHPDYRPSSRDLHAVCSHFAVRSLRLVPRQRPQLDWSIAEFFKSKDVYIRFEEAGYPTSDPKKAALFDANRAVTYRLRTTRYVRGGVPDTERAWNKANLTGAALEEYEQLMAECARYIEAIENQYLARVAASVDRLALEIRQLPKTAELGETTPLESAGTAVHWDAKSYGRSASLRPAPYWTMTKKGWTADVEIHSCTDRFGDIREEVEQRLGRRLGCEVKVLDQGGPYVCVRATVRGQADAVVAPR